MVTPISAGLLRLRDIIKPSGLIPISASSWWAGVKSGRFPAPVKLGPRITAWKSEDIRKLIEEGIPRSGLATKSGARS